MLLDLERDQAGIAARRQLLAAGLTAGQIRRRLETGQWQVVESGIYATFSGPVPSLSRVWAAVHRAGAGAAAGPRTTLWLTRAVDRPPDRLDVVIPGERLIRGDVRFDVRRCRGLDHLVNPVARPPRLRLEVAVLDLAAEFEREPEVVDLVIGVVQRRLTTGARLQASLGGRRGHRWRGLLMDLLADVCGGVRSPLELYWLRGVERAHGLPPSIMNRPDDEGGRRCYRDVEYLPWGLVVELDGREAHPDVLRFRDRQRDNRLVVSGRQTLRYGWHEVVGDPCGAAGEVAAVLRSLGWPGEPAVCGPRCRLTA